MTILSLPSLPRRDDSLSAPSSISTDISSSDISYRLHEANEMSGGSHLQAEGRERSAVLEEDDSDPSHWIEISENDDNRRTGSMESPWRSSSSRQQALRSSRSSSSLRSSRSSPSIIKLQIPSLLCDFFSFFYDWTVAAVEVWTEVLTSPPFPLETLQKVSIVLLAVERIRDNFEQSTLIVFVNADGTPLEDSPFGLDKIPHYLIWGIPTMIAVLSIAFVLTLQLSWGHQEEAVIATALILLIFLEALLPLFILGCTSMFLFQQVSWEVGLALLVIVWLGSTFCAHCIRRMLYRSMGHG